jgi:hypothetical protein
MFDGTCSRLVSCNASSRYKFSILTVPIAFPPVFFRFRIPIYPGSHPVYGYPGSDEKLRQRKWVRGFPTRSRSFSSLELPSQIKLFYINKGNIRLIGVL